MKNKVYIPQINYLVFELVRIDVDLYKSETASYRAEQVETIYLATLPTQFDYDKTGRDSITKTGDKTFVQKFSYMPIRGRISGTFGERPRIIAGTYLDGWARLRQFDETIIDKSKDVSSGKYIYTLNYYDFIWQKFGEINIRGFKINGNAQQNAKLPNYSCDFEIVGDLVKVNSKDPILGWLNTTFGESSLASSITGVINTGLEAIQPALTLVGVGVEMINTTVSLVSNASSYIQNTGGFGQALHTDVGSLF